MATNIETHIELEQQSISKADLLEIHQNKLLRDETNVDSTSELIEILGGIDNILLDYLSLQSSMILTLQIVIKRCT